jgi:MFS superfamily sulfate permease-like transporter
MVWNIKDYLPDFQGALKGFYEESLKNTVETKTQEFKTLLEKNIAYGQKTQKALIAIALGIFLLLAIAYFWKDYMNQIPYKYLALGILVGCLIPYIYSLTQTESSN